MFRGVLSLRLVDQRPVRLCSCRHIAFIRDVYKTIGYAAPFSEAEKETILTKLNSLQEEQLSKYIAKKNSRNISAYREKYGSFTCVEQLLGEDSLLQPTGFGRHKITSVAEPAGAGSKNRLRLHHR